MVPSTQSPDGTGLHRRPSCSGRTRLSPTSSCSRRASARITSTSASRTAGRCRRRRRRRRRQTLAQQAVDAVLQAWERAEAARGHGPVEATDPYDANPWLRMMRRAQYLKGTPPADLLRSVEVPDPDTADPVEQGVQVLVRKHVQPCQQILASFARTQHLHGQQAWKRPVYHHRAAAEVGAAVAAGAAPRAAAGAPGGRRGAAAASERACLEFCVELMNHRRRSHENESVLLDPAALQIVEIWQTQQTAGPWALQSADDELADVDEGYASGSTANSPVAPLIEGEVGDDLPGNDPPSLDSPNIQSLLWA
ncbi:predicted protein [Aspergillus terreus NIH2624]|uniref:Uncharacterized protein n=1 Tax=Aspergillus terreus (strain NIH 2624 / FGSC A1156) TaxID=341663 RepID=Q0CCV3_ASPTN|nr:uncharacterized protein ATEG_08481 [Aspergillus terreus NIH2624]EAU31654.1 predicted protein [Aspergillus terreus NIH2624]